MPHAPFPTVAPTRLAASQEPGADRQPAKSSTTGSEISRAAGGPPSARPFSPSVLIRVHPWLILLFSVLFSVSAFSQINITYSAQDFSLSTNGLLRISITPIAKAGDYTNTFLLPTPLRPDTFTNGVAVFSNKVPGYAYSVAFETTFSTTRRTNFFPTTLTGNVNGIDYIGHTLGFARDGSVIDFAYLYPSNLTSTITVISSNVAWIVSSTNGGGGGSTEAVTATGASVVVTNASVFSVITTNASGLTGGTLEDRKSTRLNSSHSQISYAVFCLKK